MKDRLTKSIKRLEKLKLIKEKNKSNFEKGLNSYEIKRIQTFPEDFNFLNTDPCYVMGMSVPPFMTQRVALEIYNNWFKTKNN